MTEPVALEWISGDGWLVLAEPDDDPSGALRASALHKLGVNRGFAFLGLNETTGDAEMADMEDLGAPTGYLINVVTEDDDTIISNLRDVGLIMLDPSADPRRMLDALIGATSLAMRDAYLRGAVIYAEGPCASLFGACWRSAGGGLHEGLGWITDAQLLFGIGDQAALRAAARPTFETRPRTVALGVPSGSALALGPSGQIEVWGPRPISVTLGPGKISNPANRSN
ncbi:MAG: hypothetical protein IT298_15940 [Chloroflexi bacterium]|jgi:hypothetical protein|nr:MAG: hypothetical protein UZ13_02517 [Chloroflexi bacterium OLB13]MBC6954571.1 hypothetical protein [Chloroflexota bacterium]MBV6434808.1 hypothetical protein [Anaerolineae bacterium]MDL1914366.1 hypothetical protein [Anaerolineae bacterium CFX4]OQY83797.1 MAG: hypothetical protein B6D42_06515 [Anaerolineae bacterium UTCFX5]